MNTKAPDALVIGAGPAGALTALLLARAGVETRLVDRAAFPRPKLCGGCLATPGLETLARNDLSSLDSLSEALRVDRLHLCTSGRALDVSIPQYRVINRAVFDHDLVRSATDAGARFLDRTRASVSHDGRVDLVPNDRACEQISPRVVIVADGLKGDALRSHPAFSWITRRNSRVGLGAIASSMPARCPLDAVTMFHGPPGYAGVAGLADGRAVIAAAADRAWLATNRDGPPLHALLRTLGLDPADAGTLGSAHGSPMLTRRRSALEADARVFVLGDAAGYIEPFTGEGMTWALESAERITPHVVDAVEGRYRPGRWTKEHNRGAIRRTFLCHATARLLRRPALTRTIVSMCRARPTLASGIARAVLRLQARPSSTIGTM